MHWSVGKNLVAVNAGSIYICAVLHPCASTWRWSKNSCHLHDREIFSSGKIRDRFAHSMDREVTADRPKPMHFSWRRG
jgi:hypothetical protein